MEQVERAEDWRTKLEYRRARGQRVGLVPTMGALHEGHLSLIQAAREAGANFITLSVFVNPTQFNDSADLEAYPRQLQSDLQACRGAGVDLVFTPSTAEMRQSKTGTQVTPPDALCTQLEGAHRLGHFVGMATIVTKLLVLAGPCIAVFGKKDYQQLAIIRRLQHDLLLATQVVAAEIVREPSGLACSSRNARLSAAGRKRASALYAALSQASERFTDGCRDPKTLRDLVYRAIEDSFDSIDYVEVVERGSLLPFADQVCEDAVILCAASVEGVRLIDNMELSAAS